MIPTSAPIMHPTDFSDLSMNAFAHALKISLAAKCKLYIVHIAARQDADEWQAFPHVRETLARWGLLSANESTAAIFDKLGVEVAKVEIAPQNPVQGLARFLAGHPSDLMVLATRGRDGLPRWVRPSIAEAMSRRTHMQTIFVPAPSAGFVDAASGALNLERILVPLDHHPPAPPALAAIKRFCSALGVEPAIHALHVGTEAPNLPKPVTVADGVTIELRAGNVVDTILQAAAEIKANLIAMATAGHDGVLDAIRGSTTERVLRHALAVPVASP